MPRGIYPRKKPTTTTQKVCEAPIPEGCTIVDRTAHIELSFTTHSKWLPYAQQLAQMPASKAMILDMGDAASLPNVKKRVSNIKNGIKHAWTSLNLGKGVVRGGLVKDKLYLWVNR